MTISKLFGFALVALLLLSVATAAEDNAQVTFFHASPDAPPVDIYVNKELVVEDLDFESSTEAFSLPASTYNVQVTAAGNPEAVVIDADVLLKGQEQYAVFAVDTLNAIRPLVVENNKPIVPQSSAKVRFLHASPDAPNVDIAVKGGPTLLSNVAFSDISSYLTLPAGVYTLEVLIAGTDKVALSVPATIFSRTAYTAVVTGFAGDGSLNAVIVQDEETSKREQVRAPRVSVLHASPDAPTVQISVDNNVAVNKLSFGESAGPLFLSPGMYDIAVTPFGANAPVVIDASLDLKQGTGYTIVAANFLDSIQPIVVETPPRTSRLAGGSVQFVHASPDAPAVDVAVAGGPVLFSDIAFGESTKPLNVRPGTYDLEVRLAGTDTTVLSVEDFRVRFQSSLIAATGLVADNSLAATSVPLR